MSDVLGVAGLAPLSVEYMVKNGVRLLDEYIPDWYSKIDLNKLNTTWSDCCIGGQLGMKYPSEYSKIGLNVCSYSQLNEYGFGWGGLPFTLEWMKVIVIRRGY